MTHSLLDFNLLIEWHAATYITNITHLQELYRTNTHRNVVTRYSCIFSNYTYMYKSNLCDIPVLALQHLYGCA